MNLLRRSKNQIQIILDEFYRDCRIFSYKKNRKNWITFYDIETVYQYFVIRDYSDQTKETLIRLQVTIEKMQEKFKSKSMPLRALKILIKTAKKANRIEL